MKELVELQRAVIQGAGQSEAVLYQRAFTGHVALVHATDLRDGHVGFVDDQKKVFREVVQQAVGSGACRTPVDVAGIVFNTRGETHRLHHLEVVCSAHFQALRFEQFVLFLKFRQAHLQFFFNCCDRLTHPVFAGYIV